MTDLVTKAGASTAVAIFEKLIAAIPNVIQLSGVNDISRLISDEAGKQITKDQNLQKLVAELLEKDLRIHIKGKEIVLSSLHIVHGPIKTIEEMVYSHPYVVLAACIGMTFITTKLELFDILWDFLPRKRPSTTPTNN